ncbi:hypothetical protein [Nocardioides insulae]|uniref:hypothetical protein n=1 Tax=Nocardioides insulae TaxID=394734 RepID=UPI00040CB21B|nr:hypothetical protein [Nocardioides insulae]
MAATHAWHGLVHDMRDEMHDLATISRVSAARQAYLALWITFIALPLVAGLDKLIGLFSTNWEMYVAGWVNDIVPGDAGMAVMWMGVIEIALAVVMLAAPRVGGDLLALWFALVAVNLFSIAEMNELGLFAVALAVCSLACARFSTMFHHKEGMTPQE